MLGSNERNSSSNGGMSGLANRRMSSGNGRSSGRNRVRGFYGTTKAREKKKRKRREKETKAKEKRSKEKAEAPTVFARTKGARQFLTRDHHDHYVVS